MAAADTSIVISANANKAVAEFARLTASARSAASQITSALRGISGAMAGLGAGLTFAGMTAFVKSSIDAADALNDLSKRTGVAATTIGGIGFAAQQAGGDLEGAAQAFKSFNKVISEAIGGNKEAVDNFAKLGISLRDLKSLSPDQLLIKAADAFQSFADGAEKAAGMQVFFGKGAASVAGLLDEGGASLRRNIEYYKRYSGVTDELVRASDQFNDSLTKINLIQQSFGRYLSAALLPSMQSLADYLLAARESSDRFKQSAEGVAEVIKVLAKAAILTGGAFKIMGDFIAAGAAQLAAVATLDFGGAFRIGKEWAADFDRVKGTLGDLLTMVDKVQQKSGASGFGGVGTDRGVGGAGRGKTPNFTKAAAGPKAVDEYATQLERVRKITAEAQAEMDAMFSGEKITTAAKALAQLLQDSSFQKLPEQQRKYIQGFYETAIAIQKETEALKESRAAREEQQKLFDEARKQHAADLMQFGERVEQYRLSNDALSREIALVGQDDAARQKLAATIEFEAMEREANALGAREELEILKKQFEERKKLIDELAAKVKEFNRTEQIRSIFADNFADQLAQVVDGTKSLSSAFKDMERAIVSSISRIAAQNIADVIFGKAGSGGGFGDIASWFGNLLSGGLAGGTNFAFGGPTLVGEKGPEIVNLPRGASVTPNNRIGGNVVSINVNVPAGTNSASADRIALVTGQAVQRALRRNG